MANPKRLAESASPCPGVSRVFYFHQRHNRYNIFIINMLTFLDRANSFYRRVKANKPQAGLGLTKPGNSPAARFLLGPARLGPAGLRCVVRVFMPCPGTYALRLTPHLDNVNESNVLCLSQFKTTEKNRRACRNRNQYVG